MESEGYDKTITEEDIDVLDTVEEIIDFGVDYIEVEEKCDE